MRQIVKTAFCTSVITYVTLFLSDYIRPGFVSYIFSVHLVLIPVILFGVWWAFLETGEQEPEPKSRLWRYGIMALSLGLLLAVIFWREGHAFGDFRLVLAAVGFFAPLIILSLLREPNR